MKGNLIKKIGIYITSIVLITILTIFVIGYFYRELYEILETIFNPIFNNWIPWIYLGISSSFNAGGCCFGLAFLYMKRNYLRGYLTSLLGSLLMFLSLIILIVYTNLALIFTNLLALEVKLLVFFTFLLASLPILLLSLEKLFDVSTFFKDIWRQKEDYHKLTYRVEEKGKLVYIHIEKNGSNVSNIFEAAPTLKIQEVLHAIKKNPDVSLSFYLKSALLFFITEIVLNFTSWPRARNRLLRRFTQMKIGKDVCISQWTQIDPLFPDLIEFEEGSGVGVGCQLLTHNFMEKDPLTIGIGPIKIKKGARIGAFSTLLPGVTVGEGAIVGTGSLVADDIPPHTIAYGVPARVIKKIENLDDQNSIKI